MNWLSRQARRLISARILGAVLLVALLALRFADPPTLEDLRLRAFDIFQNMSPRVIKEGQRPVVIVHIDEKSLAKLGQWPWAPTRIAELINKLNDAGAAAIG